MPNIYKNYRKLMCTIYDAFHPHYFRTNRKDRLSAPAKCRFFFIFVY